MRMQRTIAIVIILSGSALTAWVSRDIAFPAVLCMLGLLGLRRRFTWDFKPQKRAVTSILLLILAVLFALHCAYYRPSLRMGHEAAMTFAWQTVTRYFLASMILMLYLGSPRRLPLSLGLFHLAITICAGQILLLDDRFIAFRLLEVFSVVLAVLYLTACHEPADLPMLLGARRRPYWIAAGIVLLVAVNGAWSVSSMLYRHVEALNYVPIWFARQTAGLGAEGEGASTVGFSDSGRLSSMAPILQDRTIALTITSDEPPGYLRAEAFEVYRTSEWSDLSIQEAVAPERSSPFAMYLAGRANTFRLTEREPSEPKSMTIRHEFRFGRTMFAPLGTCRIDAPLNLLLRDDNDIVQTQHLDRGRRYQITYSPYAYRRSLTGTHRSRMLDVPPHLDARILQLANEIFAGCQTTDEKIAAVVDYFRTRYTYSLDLAIPPGRDHLTYFLLEENRGYCEYFASGAALLLRLVDVPTRYVTGFLVTARDPQSGAWLARNLDAHAWVEAWDDSRNRWTLVEATVQQDLSSVSSAGETGLGAGGPGQMLGQLFQAMYSYGLLGVATWFFSSCGLWPRSLVLTALLAGFLWWAISHRRGQRQTRAKRRSRAAPDPSLAALRKTLARMDRRVNAVGLRRNLAETLGAFADRLRNRDTGDGRWIDVSDWYLEYADLRYCRTIEAPRLARLQQRAASLRKHL
ncbi:MAG: transglutaminase domain-containing protein [Sedimentisphaerales bacterium]|nr:transglutaminase domain-containing protein [Sedimentisphaerales bacterium]